MLMGLRRGEVAPLTWKDILSDRMCRNLGIQISRDKMKGPHSFRRNGITKVCNLAGGNIVLASMLYGNSPECASRNYYTGLDLVTARQLLESS